jgi:cyclopropane fatty-acyl-phospholipid synthase-like methyltransferase
MVANKVGALVEAGRSVERLEQPRRARSFPWRPAAIGRDLRFKTELAARQRELAERFADRTERVEACPVCGGAPLRELASIGGYPFGECPSCLHVTLQRRPTEPAVREFFASQAGPAASVSFHVYGDPARFAARVAAVAVPKVHFVGARVGPATTWLDLGCGVGEVLEAARTAGWSVRGVDGDAAEVAQARSRGFEVRHVWMTATDLPALTPGAAVVSLLNVLDHVGEPASFLAGLADGMDPGAWLAVEVPRHPSLSALCNGAFPDLAHRHLYPPHHLHVYSERSLGLLLEAAGLVAEHVWVFGQDAAEMLDSLSLRAGRTELEAAYAAAVEGIQEAIDDRGLSDRMLVLARKPMVKADR